MPRRAGRTPTWPSGLDLARRSMATHSASDAAGDAELWRGAAVRQPGPREKLCARVAKVAGAELVRRGAPWGSLDDLLQEAQRTVLAFIERNPLPPRDLDAFLKYRAWGVLSDHRKRMRNSPITPTADFVPPASRARAVEADLSRQDLERALGECRGQLPSELRRVLELRYASSLDGESMGRRLGVHRNTIHVRVFRALQRLRECLTARGFGPEDLA